MRGYIDKLRNYHYRQATNIAVAINIYFHYRPDLKVLLIYEIHDYLVMLNCLSYSPLSQYNSLYYILRDFDKNGILTLIPQCVINEREEYYFVRVENNVGLEFPSPTDDEILNQPTIIEYSKAIDKMVDLTLGDSNLELRRRYNRAGFGWSTKETKMLLEVLKITTDPFVLSKITQRSPGSLITFMKNHNIEY